jgi:hypothetical protein
VRIWEPPRWLVPGLLPALFGALVLGLAWYLGQASSLAVLAALLGLGGALVLLRRPPLGLVAIVLSALLFPLEIGTGTEVPLVPVALVIPAVGAIWLLDRLRQGHMSLLRSRVNLPLALFLAAGGLSLLAGNALWDPAVPYSDHFILVQLSQWAIFVLSALAFWLMAHLAQDGRWLERLTWSFLVVGTLLALLYAALGPDRVLGKLATIALIRAPFWILLAALAGGQLLFNRRLSSAWRWLAVVAVAAVVHYAFVLRQDAISNWVSVAIVAGVLVWLRWPRRRWWLVGLVALGLLLGNLFPALYNFAGGDEKWAVSGASRLVLSECVITVALRNPLTGLGPASYRPYANLQPLKYGRTYWVKPNVSSHNNYVDLFAHTGLLGLGLYLWFVVELARLGGRLSRQYRADFCAGYVNGLLAALAAVSVSMLLLDWFLPFVYNVGFVGFQASVLLWMFLGGLVALESMSKKGEGTPDHAT